MYFFVISFDYVALYCRNEQIPLLFKERKKSAWLFVSVKWALMFFVTASESAAHIFRKERHVSALKVCQLILILGWRQKICFECYAISENSVSRLWISRLYWYLFQENLRIHSCSTLRSTRIYWRPEIHCECYLQKWKNFSFTGKIFWTFKIFVKKSSYYSELKFKMSRKVWTLPKKSDTSENVWKLTETL